MPVYCLLFCQQIYWIIDVNVTFDLVTCQAPAEHSGFDKPLVISGMTISCLKFGLVYFNEKFVLFKVGGGLNNLIPFQIHFIRYHGDDVIFCPFTDCQYYY